MVYRDEAIGLFAFVLVSSGRRSASAGTITGTPALQARYIARQAELLDAVSALAWLHLTFADLDLSAYPPPLPANLPLFERLLHGRT